MHAAANDFLLQLLHAKKKLACCAADREVTVPQSNDVSRYFTMASRATVQITIFVAQSRSDCTAHDQSQGRAILNSRTRFGF